MLPDKGKFFEELLGCDAAGFAKANPSDQIETACKLPMKGGSAKSEDSVRSTQITQSIHFQ